MYYKAWYLNIHVSLYIKILTVYFYVMGYDVSQVLMFHVLMLSGDMYYDIYVQLLRYSFLVWILRFTAFGENIAFTSSQTVQESEDKSTNVTTSTHLFVGSDPPKVVRPYPTMYLHNWCCNKRAIRVPLSIKAWCCHIHDYSVAPIIDTLRPRHRKNNAIFKLLVFSEWLYIEIRGLILSGPKCISLNEKVWISIKVSLKWAP